MKLWKKFILFAGGLHLSLLVLAFYLLEFNKTAFVITELVILISIFFTINLYRSFIKPLNILAAGIESIKERDFSVQFNSVGQYELDQLIGVYNKMISNLREERIKQTEKNLFLEKLINASPSGILILGFDEQINALNPAAQELIKAKAIDVVGKKLCEIDRSFCNELSMLKSGESKIIQAGVQSFKCHKAHFIDRGFHHHFIIIEELTAEILKTEKKAYEKVIRMMTHEINNSIGAINSILQSSLGYKEQLQVEDKEEFSEVMQVCIDRNSRLSKFMSRFADVVKVPTPNLELVDLKEVIAGSKLLVAQVCREKSIKLLLESDDQPFGVKVDVQQIEQVLINVIKNAIEAIGENGTIKFIFTRNPDVLIIQDTGKGIPAEVKSQLFFSPFYTNKKEGQGIGLTLCKEILLNHGFDFSLDSGKEGLTEFRIRF
jgi:two-component system, NtrC family, nitrogen regulation sensor histidine kinase NtrY